MCIVYKPDKCQQGYSHATGDWLGASSADNWLAALMNTVLTYLSTTSLVRMTSRLKKTGLPNS